MEEIKRLRADKMFPSVVMMECQKVAVNQICRITLQYWMNRFEILKKERLNKVQKYR